MQTTPYIWMNGKWIPWNEAQVHVLTHTLHYGGGAFEGIRCYKTEKGPAIFRLPEHADRLLYSVKTLKMPFSYSQEEICSIIKEVVKKNELEEGYIRPIAFYGYGKMNVNPTGSPVEFAIACWPWAAYLAKPFVDVKTSRYIRIHPKSTVVDAKLCGHYLNGILASIELQGTHYHEALFLDDQGFISEGAGENFFMVKAGKIFTPKLSTILAGITRDTIIKLLGKMNFEVIESDITLKEAYEADEAFFTGTAVEVTPIRSIDDQALGKGEMGPVSLSVKQAYSEVVRGKDPNFSDCLSFIQKEKKFAV